MSPPSSHSPPNNRTRVRRRTDRSKTGCNTCKDRRVKCDEISPLCGHCSRLRLVCDRTPRPSARERRNPPRRNSETPIAPQPAVAESQFDEAGLSSFESTEENTFDDEVIPDQDGDTYNTIIASNPNLVPDQFDITFPVPNGQDQAQMDAICGFDMSQFTPMWHPPSPLMETIFGTATAFVGLPGEITIQDLDALNFYASDCTFGFGSKRPKYSTHAILRRKATHSPALNHLLLAAASGECWYARGATDSLMLDNAAKNYAAGHRLLAGILSNPNSDPLDVMGSFWFLYISQRRRPAKLRVAYQALSSLMADYITNSRLVEILLSPLESQQNAEPHAGTKYTAKDKALLARLVTWLFWVDTQACFQGDGGSMARALLRSTTSQGLVDIFELSTNALWLNFDYYPADEVLDDRRNKNSFKLLHQFWVLVQEINEMVDQNEDCELNEEQSLAIQSRLDALRRSPSVNAMFVATESKDKKRPRELANCDWAAAQFYVLCIYHRRCTAGILREERIGGEGRAETLDTLLTLIQKSLAVPDRGQIDRMQWPLFWAGIEADTQFARDWISERLVNPALQRALEIVLLEQAEGVRLSMKRIRQICQLTCCEVDSGIMC